MTPLIYTVPENMSVSSGDIVKIGLRKSMTWGVVTKVGVTLPPELRDVPLKSIDQRIMSTVLFADRDQTEFLRWLASYYIFPFPKIVKQIWGPFLSKKHNLPKNTDGQQNSPIPTTPASRNLTGEQTHVIESISERWNAGDIRTTLLFGITGSGKSEVYARLADRVLDAGKKVLYLVPEIGLTAGTLSHIESRIGHGGTLLHGKLPRRERYRNYSTVTSGQKQLIIGTRSTVLYPFTDLGLIIVDEEHDGSYKNMEPPYYNARDCAVMKGSLMSVPVLLGSATPSSESFHNADTGKYHREYLTKRVNNKPLPPISTFTYRGDTHIPPEAADTIRTDIHDGFQTLFFLNRRGFATIASCDSCGYIDRCPHCETALIFHKRTGNLTCHHCSYHKKPGSCPECNAPALTLQGAGIEKLYDSMRELFPEATLESIDRDSQKNTADLEQSLKKIINGSVDIFAGTVMVSKGHNFPALKNVVIKFSDYLLNFSDYRAAEKCFQTVIQVAGRAGRFSREGRVWTEMLKPDHYLWKYLPRYDYKGFMRQELHWRKMLNLPPFSHLITVRITGPGESPVTDTARTIHEFLRRALTPESFNVFRLFPPIEPPLSRIQKRFRNIITLQVRPAGPLQTILRRIPEECPVPRSVHVTFDIDAVSSS